MKNDNLWLVVIALWMAKSVPFLGFRYFKICPFKPWNKIYTLLLTKYLKNAPENHQNRQKCTITSEQLQPALISLLLKLIRSNLADIIIDIYFNRSSTFCKRNWQRADVSSKLMSKTFIFNVFLYITFTSGLLLAHKWKWYHCHRIEIIFPVIPNNT